MISTGFETVTALGFASCDPKIVARYAEPFAREGGGCFTPEDAFDVVDLATSVVVVVVVVVVSTVESTVAPIKTDLTPSGVGSAGFALATVAEDDEEPSRCDQPGGGPLGSFGTSFTFFGGGWDGSVGLNLEGGGGYGGSLGPDEDDQVAFGATSTGSCFSGSSSGSSALDDETSQAFSRSPITPGRSVALCPSKIDGSRI